MVKTSAFLVLVGFFVQNGFVSGYSFEQFLLQSRITDRKKIHNPEFICSITIKDANLFKRCSGSLITSKFVLTSALCMEGGNPKTTFINCGSQATLCGWFKKRHQIAKIIKHPDFDIHTGKNSIALIELQNVLKSSTTLKPIGLNELPVKDGDKVEVIGWNGDRHCDSSYPLRSLGLKVLSVANCKKRFSRIKNADLDNIICTYSGPGQDTCEKDIGAPLICSKSKILIGVYNDVLFSYDEFCDERHDHPVFFTDVIPYVPWLQNITKSLV